MKKYLLKKDIFPGGNTLREFIVRVSQSPLLVLKKKLKNLYIFKGCCSWNKIISSLISSLNVLGGNFLRGYSSFIYF